MQIVQIWWIRVIWDTFFPVLTKFSQRDFYYNFIMDVMWLKSLDGGDSTERGRALVNPEDPQRNAWQGQRRRILTILMSRT